MALRLGGLALAGVGGVWGRVREVSSARMKQEDQLGSERGDDGGVRDLQCRLRDYTRAC